MFFLRHIIVRTYHAWRCFGTWAHCVSFPRAISLGIKDTGIKEGDIVGIWGLGPIGVSSAPPISGVTPL